jgi:hypothetical protein
MSVAEDVVMESLGFSSTCLDEAALLALSASLPSTRAPAVGKRELSSLPRVESRVPKK